MFAFTMLDSVDVGNYTRDHLMAAREYVLLIKRTARKGGFGEIAGRMVRDTIGYKFDAMPVDAVLSAMATDGFLPLYTAAVERWYAGLNKSATESTLKGNAAKYSAALSLAGDPVAFKRLVNALRILCVRNQAWTESGANVALTYNGHRALLDLFNVNVTNTRRLSLSAN